MPGADSPAHTRLRPRIQQITDDLLDVVQHQGTMDLIADFAFPLPFTVITDMLGIPVKAVFLEGSFAPSPSSYERLPQKEDTWILV